MKLLDDTHALATMDKPSRKASGPSLPRSALASATPSSPGPDRTARAPQGRDCLRRGIALTLVLWLLGVAPASAASLRVLVSNDDGIDHPGLAALAQELRKKHEVVVVAPDRNRSGAGHSVSTNSSFRVFPRFREGRLFGYAVNGTPAESVEMGVMLFGKTNRFHLVVAGINPGQNTGHSHFTSGTEAAAREGRLCGIPAMAVSLAGEPTNFLFAARFVGRFIDEIHPEQWKQPVYWSINIPEDASSIKGVKVVPSDGQVNIDFFFAKEIKDAEGEAAYQIEPTPEMLSVIDDPKRLERALAGMPEDAALQAGYITISPQRIDTFHESALKALRRRSKQFEQLLKGL